MDADDVAYDVGYDMLMMVGQCLYMRKLQKKWKNKKLKKINKEKIQTTYIYIHIFNKNNHKYLIQKSAVIQCFMYTICIYSSFLETRVMFCC